MKDAAVDNPLDLLAEDRARARQQKDLCADVCTLATVDSAGNPQARTLVLREIEGRLALFGNETSPKWRQLEHSATLAVVVWLPTVQVQYRLQCETRPVPKATVHESWQLRPEAPKRLDWYYTRVQGQSSAVADREALVGGVAELTLREPLVAPRTAAGIYLEPRTVERLDLDRPDGIHDRVMYRHHAGGWQAVILVP